MQGLKIHLPKKKLKLFLSLSLPLFLFPLTGYCCSLALLSMALIACSFVLALCLLWIMNEKNKSRHAKVDDSFFYMEQMIYSFKKHYKILKALQDTLELAEGELRISLKRAIRMIADGQSEDIFQSALNVIEENYGSSLMHNLHLFLIHVETEGGEADQALKLLMSQINSCKSYEDQYRKKAENVRKKLKLSLFLSCFMLVAVRRLFPDMLKLEELPIYQAVTCAGILLFLLLYVCFSYDRLNGCSEATIDYAKKMTGKHHRAKKTEIEEAFSVWMYEMLLRIQTENILSAAYHSIDSSPSQIAGDLYHFCQEIEEDPVSRIPYQNFMADYEIPEIRNMMLTLYSVNLMGKEEICRQIEILLSQNIALKETAMEAETEKKLALQGLGIILPMSVSFGLLAFQLGLMMFEILKDFSLGFHF